MAGYQRLKEITENSFNGGQSWMTSFRKVPALTTVQGNWFDLSMAPGNPRPNYYATAQYEAITLSGRNGIYHGGNVSPQKKYLHKLGIGSVNAGVAPATYMLCDYLMYYPLIDMDSTEEQFLTNDVTLPRYSDGAGVQAFLVSTNPYVGGQRFQLNYTDSNGVSGKTTVPVLSNLTTQIGTVINSGTTVGQGGPFISLYGSSGIRSVESITFFAPNGGLAALVLAKPLATVVQREITAYSETDFLMDLPSAPRIYDDAYLNLLCLPNGSASGQVVYGILETIWN